MESCLKMSHRYCPLLKLKVISGNAQGNKDIVYVALGLTSSYLSTKVISKFSVSAITYHSKSLATPHREHHVPAREGRRGLPHIVTDAEERITTKQHTRVVAIPGDFIHRTTLDHDVKRQLYPHIPVTKKVLGTPTGRAKELWITS